MVCLNGFEIVNILSINTAVYLYYFIQLFIEVHVHGFTCLSSFRSFFEVLLLVFTILHLLQCKTGEHAKEYICSGMAK